MASIILQEITSSLGGHFFGEVGEFIGNKVGKHFGGKLDKALFFGRDSQSFGKESRNLAFDDINNSAGKFIPLIYGTARVEGQIIWHSKVKDSLNVTLKDIDIFGINQHMHTSHNYSISLAIGICEGIIEDITRLWINNHEISINSLNFRLYKGSDNQTPDHLLETSYGIGNTPAFRGLAYLVIDDFPIKQFGYGVPVFAFEVKRKLLLKDDEHSLEKKLKSVVIIPGSGEFVYDSKIQYKQLGKWINNTWIESGIKGEINLNNNSKLSDAELSLNQLKNDCPNIKWSAPVASWYANSMDIKNCTIKPGVEYQDNVITTPDLWRVAGFERKNAYLLSKDKNLRPNYGGTTADISLIRYIELLKSKNLKVMFYPMFLIDLPNKPWRGRLTGNACDIKDFFNRQYGYKNFILHYANLVKGKVDAFIIGSELIGLTKICDKNHNFLAVEQLIELASAVKNILGPNVVVTYAADWSEYHHTEGGWYNLDALWASKDIDVIGIDAYFPLTNFKTEKYDKQSIIDGWASGEGYDYYLQDNKKHALNPAYAWKNINYWWSNEHYNPNNQKSAWKPKSKKIWFTELGFPSVDCATNQPNVFYDPKSRESALPKNSKGYVDFLAQEIALEASLSYWEKYPEIVENIFIWCWDARPYPFWPNFLNIWADGNCWSRGHWINGKIGKVNLASVILDLCIRSGIKQENLDVSSVLDKIDGLYISRNYSVQEILDHLLVFYNLQIIEKDNKILFKPKINHAIATIDYSEILIDKQTDHSTEIIKISEHEIPNVIKVNFFDNTKGYKNSSENIFCQNYQVNRVHSLTTPLLMNIARARTFAENLLNYYKQASVIYKFKISKKFANLENGDLIKLQLSATQILSLRILLKSLSSDNQLEFATVIDDYSIEKYQENNINFDDKLKVYKTHSLNVHVLDLPILPFEINHNNRILIAAEGFCKDTNYEIIKTQLAEVILSNEVTIGKLVNEDQEFFIISIIQGKLIFKDDDNLNIFNLALIGDEIIKFSAIVINQNGDYKVKIANRGLFDTKINTHQSGERFIILDNNLTSLALPQNIKLNSLIFTDSMDNDLNIIIT